MPHWTCVRSGFPALQNATRMGLLEKCPCPHLTAVMDTCKRVSFHCKGLKACLWRDLRSCIRALFEFLFLKEHFAVNRALETCWSHVFTSPQDHTHPSICLSSIHWVYTGSESYSLNEYHAQQACSFLQACWLQESALTLLCALRNGLHSVHWHSTGRHRDSFV